MGTSGAGVPPGDPIEERSEPSSVATQKFLFPVLLKVEGAELPTNWVLIGEPPDAKPAAKKTYPDLWPIPIVLSRTHAVAGLGVQPAAGPLKLFRSGAYPNWG